MRKIVPVMQASLVALLLASLFVTGNSMIAVSQVVPAEEIHQISARYGCGAVDMVVHCDPVLSDFESYEVSATTQKIYSVTRPDSEIPFVSGINGSRALEFHAYFGEFLNITNNAAINSQQFSVSFWAKKNPEFANYGQVMSHADAGLKKGWIFDIANTTAQSIRFSVFNSDGAMFSPKEVELDAVQFVHIVGTFDGSTVKIYRNGELAGAPANFTGQYIADPQVPLKVALVASQFSFPWSGVIDDIAIYNRSLADNEVKAIYNSPSSAAAGAAGYWPLDGSVSDASGNNINSKYVIQTSGMAFTPDGRLLFNEKNTGKIRIMQNDTVLPRPFAVVPNLHYDMEEGLLGVAIDPEYEQNHYVYVYYTAEDSSTSLPFNRVARFTELDNRGINMTVIFDDIPAHPRGMHAGGAIAFGPDGKMYVAVGNAYLPDQSQNVTSLLGKVLRINKDGTIPADNPISGSAVYTIGQRNMYGIAFDTQNNIGLITENGDELYDEINVLAKGANYGHPSIQVPNKPPEVTATNGTIAPIRSYWKTIAPTQAIFYDETKFDPLNGRFLVGSYNNGRLYALELDPASKLLREELRVEFPYADTSPIIAVAQSPSGDVYYGGYHIYKLDSVNIESKRPILLPVKLNVSSSMPLHISDVTFDPVQKSMTVELSKAKAGQNSDGSVKLTIEIPQALLDDLISVVWNNNPASAVEYTAKKIGDSNIIEISQLPAADSNTLGITITAKATSMRP